MVKYNVDNGHYDLYPGEEPRIPQLKNEEEILA
jgi:hypothetical protein